MRRRLLAVAAALALIPAAAVVQALQDHGLSPEQAQAVVERASNVAARQAEPGTPTLFRHHVAVVAATAARANANEALARALCGDLDDAGFDTVRGACLAAERRSFDTAERYCNALGLQVAAGVRLVMRDDQRDRMRERAQAMPAVVMVAEPSAAERDARVDAALAARGWARCVEDGGP